MVAYKIIHVRREAKTIQLGVTLEAPQEELVEEFEDEAKWSSRLEELESMGFKIYVKGNTAYAVKPDVYRKI